jgi:hypothetical protein
MAPWLPGASRGYLFVLLHTAAVVAMLILASRIRPSLSGTAYFGYSGSDREEVLRWIAILLSYLVIYSGVACFATQLVRTRFHSMRSTELRLIVFLVVMGMILAPHIYDALRSFSGPPDYTFRFWMLLSPFFWQTAEVGFETIAVLMLFAGVVAVFNLPGIVTSIVELQRLDATGLWRWAEGRPKRSTPDKPPPLESTAPPT